MCARRRPSAAAEIAVPDGEEWLSSLRALAHGLQRGLLRRVEAQRERLRWLIGRAALVSPTARLIAADAALGRLGAAHVSRRCAASSADRALCAG